MGTALEWKRGESVGCKSSCCHPFSAQHPSFFVMSDTGILSPVASSCSHAAHSTPLFSLCSQCGPHSPISVGCKENQKSVSITTRARAGHGGAFVEFQFSRVR